MRLYASIGYSDGIIIGLYFVKQCRNMFRVLGFVEAFALRRVSILISSMNSTMPGIPPDPVVPGYLPAVRRLIKMLPQNRIGPSPLGFLSRLNPVFHEALIGATKMASSLSLASDCSIRSFGSGVCSNA